MSEKSNEKIIEIINKLFNMKPSEKIIRLDPSEVIINKDLVPNLREFVNNIDKEKL